MLDSARCRRILAKRLSPADGDLVVIVCTWSRSRDLCPAGISARSNHVSALLLDTPDALHLVL